MKKFFTKKIAYTSVAFICAVVMVFGNILLLASTAHAQTLAFAFPTLKATIENQIQNDRVNAIKNRQSRNQLLEAHSIDNTSTTPNTVVLDPQTQVARFVVSLSDIQNIASRIDLRTAEAFDHRGDVSEVVDELRSAYSNIAVASSTLADMESNIMSTTTDKAALAASSEQFTVAISSAKSYLNRALAELKTVVTN